MKESNFYSDDFEQLIRDKTEQYKMYPSEHVWKGVHSSLHTKRKWFIGSMSVFVTGILFLAGRELIAPSAHVIAARRTAPVAGAVSDAAKPAAPENMLHIPLASYRPATAVLSSRHNSAADDAAEDQDPVYKGINITISNPVLNQSDLSDWLSHVARLPEHAPDLAVIEEKGSIAEQSRTTEDITAAHTPDAARVPAEAVAGHREATEGTATKEENDDVRSVIESLSERGADAAIAAGASGRTGRSTSRLTNTRSERSAVTGKHAPDAAAPSTKADAAAIAEAEDEQRVNWLRDYAMNILPPQNGKGRTFLQLMMSPTVNFRTLSGIDPQGAKFGQSVSLNPSPGLGFEFGGSILFRLTRNLSIKGGLQFNFIRYQIGTYATVDQFTQSTTYLTEYGYEVDSMRQRVTRQSSQNSASSPMAKNVVTLNNDYYQLSAPIGFELRVLGNERLQLHVGATVQPSYLLSTSAYMLDENLTQYDKDPSMFRRWNVSGGVEAFLTYRMGNVRWQVGPEFRYQLLSSYTSSQQYPFTENLKSYGLKLGIVKPLP